MDLMDLIYANMLESYAGVCDGIQINCAAQHAVLFALCWQLHNSILP